MSEEMLSAAALAAGVKPVSGIAPTDAAISPSLPDEPREDLPSWPSYVVFRDASRALKAAEEAYRQAQLEYAAAVKKLSEEACK